MLSGAYFHITVFICRLLGFLFVFELKFLIIGLYLLSSYFIESALHSNRCGQQVSSRDRLV